MIRKLKDRFYYLKKSAETDYDTFRSWFVDFISSQGNSQYLIRLLSEEKNILKKLKKYTFSQWLYVVKGFPVFLDFS